MSPRACRTTGSRPVDLPLRHRRSLRVRRDCPTRAASDQCPARSSLADCQWVPHTQAIALGCPRKSELGNACISLPTPLTRAVDSRNVLRGCQGTWRVSPGSRQERALTRARARDFQIFSPSPAGAASSCATAPLPLALPRRYAGATALLPHWRRHRAAPLGATAPLPLALPSRHFPG